eukprot:TRINITY_DN4371_c0_g1_i7.p1 TRINITY_DN4371_c0_g1~~TRINITY_DN4371_c0_g1_i7.p1  ORF type:complete len:954 (+),score=217.72 TRINITY_DN4371_c0_g1_i7:165-3026(+)
MHGRVREVPGQRCLRCGAYHLCGHRNNPPGELMPPHPLTRRQELCQPQLSCTTSIADEGTQHLPANNTPGYLYNGSPSKVVKPYAPPLGDGPEWDAYNSYQTRCECADNQYGFDCTLVKSEQCPSGQVWDGTFRNLATPNKSYTCFLKSASLQSESMLPVLRTVRTNKMSIKIAATKNVQASTTLTVSMIGRFRPNNPMPNKSSCAIPDSTTLGLPYNCDFYGAEGADSCKVNKSADQSGHPYVFPSTVEVERASAECCSSAVEWLGVQMSCSISQCVGESGLVTYECQDILQINSTVPEQHRVEWSDWSDFLTRVKHGSVAFDTVDHKDGTSAASNMTLVDSTGEARTIQMQCMGGSCLEYSDLPKSWQGKHNSTTKYLNSTAGCEVDIPPPPGSARSSSTFVLIAIGAISLLAVNMLVAGVVFYRAHRLPGVVLLQPAKHQQEELLLPAGPGMLQDQHPPEQQQKPPPPPPGVAVPELGPPVGLVFEQVSYNVKGFGRTVVSEVSGCIQSHQMVAVLGPSGAGKSSMLDILASRPKVGQVNNGDSVRAFGEAGTLQRCKGIGYAMQDDFLCPDETVLESLMFAARIQLVGWADQRVHTQVNRVIDLLQLHKIANTKVGSSAEGGGISGGERKRVSIGVELVAAPSLLVLDEPTSGLDSASTAIVLQGLRAVSDAGCSTVFSIHQPPFEQFIQFDNVILMSRLGENIFTGSPESCVAYFQNLCGQEHLALPESVIASWSTLSSSPRGFTGNHGNPAEFLLSTASIKADETLHKLRDLFAQSTEFQQGVLLQISQAKAANQGVLSTPRDKSKPSSHGLKAFGLLTARATRAVVRNPSLFVSQMAVTLAIAGFIAALARNVPMDFTGVQTKSFLLNFLVLFQGMIAFSSLGSLITHKDIFVRERAAHLYPGWPYLLSKAVSYTHLRAHETVLDLVCRLLLEKKKKNRRENTLQD